jgi:DNA-binding SARP family transcriptional activator
MSAQEPQHAGTTLCLRLLGSFELRRGGEPLPRVRTRFAYWLLALLALRPGQDVERSWLAATLWPESPEARAYHSLRSSLADLRSCLGPDADRLHASSPHSLSLDLAGAEVDLLAFDAALARGDRASLEEAVVLYRGPLLEGCAEPWAFQERQVREQGYLAARERLAALAFEQGETAEAEGHLRRAVAVDPLRESTQRALMQVLAAGGNYAAALLCYRELRVYLHRELNTEPDAETQTLFEQLRREARRLAAKGSGAWSEGSGTAGLRARGEGSGPLTPDPSPLAPRSSPELPAAVLQEALTWSPMVGREGELAALERRLAAAEAGRGSTCLLAGEPGIGKTRLATEAGALARQRGFRVLDGRCDEDGAAPYQPFVEALRAYLDRASPTQAAAVLPLPVAAELVRLVPRLAETVTELPPVGTGSGPALVEAMGEFFGRLTAEEGPVLLVLEDLHWADEGSLSMLRGLARRAKELRLLIVGTYRDLPPDLQRGLEQTLAALHRERLSERLPLRRLTEAGVEQMVTAVLAVEADGHPSSALGGDRLASADGRGPTADGPMAAFVSALHQETEGNPFFVEEVLQHLVEEGAICRHEGRWQIEAPVELQVPPSVQAAIGRRLERLSAESREALTLAAVIGPQFEFEVLLQASGVEEERLVGWVEEWLGARLVIEERDRAADPRAGASREREERYQFQHALIREVLYGGISRQRQGRLHERVGLALEAVPSREEPLEGLAHHFARARSEAAREKGVEYCDRAGRLAYGLSAPAAAIQHLEQALRLLDTLPEDEARLMRRWQVSDGLSVVHGALHEGGGRSRQVLEEYLARAERAGSARGVAAAHLSLGWQIKGGREIERGRRHLETSLALCERHGLADLLPLVRRHLAHFLTREPGSDFPRAEALLRRTLEQHTEFDAGHVAGTYSRLMEVYAHLGKWNELMAAVPKCIALGGPAWDAEAGLNPLEAALDAQGRRAEFVAFCDDARRRLAAEGAPDPLAQWYLAPAQPAGHFTRVEFQDDFAAPALRPEWQWEDPRQTSVYSLTERPGFVTLRPAAGTDLCLNNISAPRLLLEVRGDFALEARMEGDWDEHDVDRSSGLLVWKDVLNFVRLEKFAMDRTFRGSIRLEERQVGFRLVGRGLLRGDTYYLRLEREGKRITALCSADGTSWLTCGHVDFPAPDPLRVGIASLQGMVAHFDWVRVLTKP